MTNIVGDDVLDVPNIVGDDVLDVPNKRKNVAWDDVPENHGLYNSSKYQFIGFSTIYLTCFS